jgi:hypothetical protein
MDAGPLARAADGALDRRAAVDMAVARAEIAVTEMCRRAFRPPRKRARIEERPVGGRGPSGGRACGSAVSGGLLKNHDER